ncbi:MAG: endonuclease/exonuclease/phosphatase family protein, partial [Anaerolineae bacterium]|nr:endonuclease/exonuclease/phosphatase family protein [Anaerolineae bacterium]
MLHCRRPAARWLWLAVVPVLAALSPFVSLADVTLPLRIRAIQGAGHISPYAGEAVTTQGLVTVVTGNGFYLQDPDPDGDDATSEGIYVYLGASPAVSPGDLVTVSGVAAEYYRGGYASGELSLTQIVSPQIGVISSAYPLPAPVTLGAGGRVPPSQVIDDDASGDVETGGSFDAASDGIDFYESLEGMRVRVEQAMVVGPTNRYGEIVVVGDGGALAGPRTARGGLLLRPDDPNPERIILDDALMPLPAYDVSAEIESVVGVLDYGYANFKLLATELGAGVFAAPVVAPIPEPSPGELSVATLNVENLAPDAPADKLAELADQVVHRLRAPDILGLQEVQDNSGPTDNGVTAADATYTALIAAIEAAGGPRYAWCDIPPLDNQDGGQPGGNIRVGLLYRPERVALVERPGGDASTPTTPIWGPEGLQLSLSPGRISPDDPAFLESRKPLAVEFTFGGHPLFLIVCHLRSKSGDDALFGRVQPPVAHSELSRLAQAQAIRGFVADLLAFDPQARVVVLGDMNDTDYSPALQALAGDRLSNLLAELPLDERYTYIYDGNAQALDHILVSDALASAPHQTYIARANVDAPYTDRPTDHEPVLARLCLGGLAPELSARADPPRLCPGWRLTYHATLTNPSVCQAMQGVSVSMSLPSGTWFGGAPEDLMGPAARYDAQTDTVTWQIEALLPGESVDFGVTLRTYTTLADGVVLSATFDAQAARPLVQARASAEAVVDRARCEPTPTPTSTSGPTATPSPTPSATPTPTATAPARMRLLLPLILRRTATLPAPHLLPIQNASGEGSYAVEWTAVAGAAAYRLEEARDDGLWAMVYAGPALRFLALERPTGHYAYRVLAEDGARVSPWSNVEVTDVVGSPPSELPQPPGEPEPAEGLVVVQVINDTPYGLRVELA